MKLTNKLKELIWGRAATGVPLSQVKSSTHETRPDKVMEFSEWAKKFQLSSSYKNWKR